MKIIQYVVDGAERTKNDQYKLTCSKRMLRECEPKQPIGVYPVLASFLLDLLLLMVSPLLLILLPNIFSYLTLKYLLYATCTKKQSN